MTSTPRHDRVALSREYSDFLIELSIALHKYGMYPSGHPSLEPAAMGVATRAAGLLVDRGQIAFGVARRQLVIEGVATNPAQPVLRRLAESLHRHHLGAVSFERGVSAQEISEALRVLSQEPEQHGPLGRQRSGVSLTWPHLRLHPLSFDGLTLGGDLSTTSPSGTERVGRGADLWVGLARAAMAAESEDLTNVPTEPHAIARAIDAQPRTVAYDQVIIGYLLQIARELKRDADGDVGALRHSLKVAMLAMGLAETLQCAPRDVRAIGVAGLLHDIGKVRIPLSVLTKPGRLTDEEMEVMRAHPVDGARILVQSDEDLGVAAVVAYEHHIMLDGGGYPRTHFPRDCARASRLVHVCDVYDALRTNRPYRAAWSSEKTLGYLEERSGTEFDPAIVGAFLRMLREGEARIRVLEDERSSVVG